MKKLALIFVVLFCSTYLTFGQKSSPFKGVITMSVSYDGTWDAATLAMQPKEVTVTISNNKSRLDINAGASNVAKIMNGDNLTQIVLINAMGMKFYVKSTKEDLEKDVAEKGTPVINYLNETKNICGYTAHKAEYITKDEFGDEKKTIVYYSEEIGNESLNFGGQFHGLKGFPLEYTVEQEQGKVTFTTTKIEKKKKISDAIFLIPSGYEEMSRDALKGMLKQQ